MNTTRPVNSSKALGRYLRDQRKKSGLTQTAMGKMVGVHQTTISDVERGVSRVQLDTLLKLIAALRMELLIRPIKVGKTDWEQIWKPHGS